MTSWEGYDVTQPSLGAEGDKGDILVIKSGNDFRDLSEVNIELEDTPRGSIRKKVIKTISGLSASIHYSSIHGVNYLLGIRHPTTPDLKSSAELRSILDNVLQSVGSTLKAPVRLLYNAIQSTVMISTGLSHHCDARSPVDFITHGRGMSMSFMVLKLVLIASAVWRR